MSRSALAWNLPTAQPLTAHVHPAVAELVRDPVVRASDDLDLLRAQQRPRLTHIWAFDTETTGHAHDARVVELAMARVCLADGTLSDARSQLLHPGVHIPADATAVHGITDAMVARAPSIATVLPKALAMVVASGLPMVAHNASFDLRLLRADAQRTDVTLPGSIAVYCSLKAARKLCKVRSRGLQALREHYGVTVGGAAHRALGDVRTLAGVLPMILREPAAQSRCLRECFPLEAML
jgi:DNA polymerase III subunit epsilon